MHLSRAHLLALLFAPAVAGLALACSSESDPGTGGDEPNADPKADGGTTPNGSTTPDDKPDTGTGGATTSGTTTKAGFGERCESAEQCQSNVCCLPKMGCGGGGNGGGGGGGGGGGSADGGGGSGGDNYWCSARCDAGSDCPARDGGPGVCNKNGYCQR